jgi:hypothetical protein
MLTTLKPLWILGFTLASASALGGQDAFIIPLPLPMTSPSPALPPANEGPASSHNATQWEHSPYPSPRPLPTVEAKNEPEEGEGSTTDADPATQAALVQNVLLFAAEIGAAEMIDTCLDGIRKLSLPALKKAIQEGHLIAALKLARFIFGKIESKLKAEAQEILDLVMEHYTDFVFSDEDHVSESIMKPLHNV